MGKERPVRTVTASDSDFAVLLLPFYKTVMFRHKIASGYPLDSAGHYL